MSFIWSSASLLSTYKSAISLLQNSVEVCKKYRRLKSSGSFLWSSASFLSMYMSFIWLLQNSAEVCNNDTKDLTQYINLKYHSPIKGCMVLPNCTMVQLKVIYFGQKVV